MDFSIRKKSVDAEMKNWGTELLCQDKEHLDASLGVSAFLLPRAFAEEGRVALVEGVSSSPLVEA